MEYGYDPASDTYSVDVKEASRPEVVGYDDTPPDPLEREVGGWEVTPSGRRVESDENDDSDIPDDMAEDLREEAPGGRRARHAHGHDRLRARLGHAGDAHALAQRNSPRPARRARRRRQRQPGARSGAA